MNVRNGLAVLALMLPLNLAGTANAEPLGISTLEWPPYTSQSLPRGGVTTALVQAAFAAAGMDVDVTYLPWKRAISTAKNDAGVVAYFPGYHCRHVNGFTASDPIGNGPLGFAENVNTPITWESIDDLGERKLKIGTVLGYANTEEFDEKAGTGWIRAIPANNDVINLRKLMLERIDLAVIDKLVMSYLLATEPTLKEGADKLAFNSRVLAEKTLYLCFLDDENGRALRDRFNAGLATIDVQKIVDAYFKEEF